VEYANDDDDEKKEMDVLNYTDWCSQAVSAKDRGATPSVGRSQPIYILETVTETTHTHRIAHDTRPRNKVQPEARIIVKAELCQIEKELSHGGRQEEFMAGDFWFEEAYLNFQVLCLSYCMPQNHEARHTNREMRYTKAATVRSKSFARENLRHALLLNRPRPHRGSPMPDAHRTTTCPTTEHQRKSISVKALRYLIGIEHKLRP
jgi:hypothetical protein